MDSLPLATPAHVPAELVFDFDIYADARIGADVHAAYAEVLREAPDIFWTPRNGGHWLVRRFAPAEAILHDYEHFSAREMHIPRVADHPVFLPLSLDPPASTPFRVAMMPAFSPAAVRALEPRIRVWAERLVGEVAHRGACDFVEDIASVFPVSIFMELMEMPLERLREFRALATGFFRSHDQAAIDAARGVILGILGDLVDERRRRPGDDLASRLLAADLGGRTPTRDEALAMCFLLFLGGMDTVTNLSGFAFRHLAGDAALQRRLAGEPRLIPKFVEEALRCFGVVNPSRLVIRDSDLLGVPFRAGDMVMCLASEAGRDDRRNPGPRHFDIDRTNPGHLAFATGPHLCLGHILARSEMRVLLEAWLARIPAFRCGPQSRLGFRIGAVVGLDALPLEWDLGPGGAPFP
jgi:cytochrome P450